MFCDLTSVWRRQCSVISPLCGDVSVLCSHLCVETSVFCDLTSVWRRQCSVFSHSRGVSCKVMWRVSGGAVFHYVAAAE